MPHVRILHSLDEESCAICKHGYGRFEDEYGEPFNAWTIRGKIYVQIEGVKIFEECYKANGWSNAEEPILPWYFRFYDVMQLLNDERDIMFGYAQKDGNVVTQNAPDDNYVISYRVEGDQVQISAEKTRRLFELNVCRSAFIYQVSAALKGSILNLVSECEEVCQLSDLKKLNYFLYE